MQQTSLQAYREIQQNIGPRQKQVYDAICKLIEPTDWEITQWLGKKDPNYVRPRRRELVKKKLIHQIGKRECKVTGRIANTWRVN